MIVDARNKKAFFYLLVIIVGAVLFFRLKYGFDQSDESHYYALAKRFSQGDRPFIDEWNPSQFFAVLLYPFYRAYTFFVPSGEGVILWGRYAYFTVQVIVACFILYLLRNKQYNWIVAIVYLMCSRQNIPGLSYYNLFMTSVLLTALFFSKYFEESKGKIYLFLSGICVSIATLSMPFFAIGVLMLSIALLVYKRIRELLLFWTGIALCVVMYFSFLFHRAPLSLYLEMIKYVLFYSDHSAFLTVDKIVGTVLSIGKVCLCGVPGFIYLLIRLRTLVKNNKLMNNKISFEKKDDIVFLISLIACVIASGVVKVGAIFLQITFLSFPYMLKELYNSGKCKERNRIIEIVLYFAGIIVAVLFWFGSNTEATCLPLGLIISVVGVTILFVKSFSSGIKLAYIICLILFTMLPRLFGPTFRDGDWWTLDTKITYGPAKGLYTEASDAYDYDKACELLDLCKNSFSNSDISEKRILISDFLPWGYLYTDFRNGSFTTWHTPISSELLPVYYNCNPDNYPDVVVLINEGFGNVNGLDGGGSMNPYNPKTGEIWDMIKDKNCISTEVGSVYW